MNKSGDGRLTVLMPMYNAAAFLPAAMKSILAQSECDFTFLIIDDGSTDASVEVAESLADSRTQIVRDGGHAGVAARLNWGLDHARSKFVARMDADDIAAPHRLACQLAFMEAHPEVGICGSWYTFSETGQPPREVRLPLDHERMRAMTVFSSPFAHPTVMFNLAHLDAAGLRYSETAVHVEDYDLWERSRSQTVLANIPEFLLYYRLHPNQAGALHGERQRVASNRIRTRALLGSGIAPSEEECALHCDYAADHEMDRIDRQRSALNWLRKLRRLANRRDDRALAAECAQRIQELRRRIGHQARHSHWSRFAGLRALFRGSSPGRARQ